MTVPPQTAPVRMYQDPAVFARERERIFARTWQYFGLEADLRRAGDYLCESVAGYPIVVVRDEQGGLKGFHNVCRHRAGPLVAEGKGRCDRQFVCRYHDWTYAFDGRLKEATGFGPADGFAAEDFTLFKVLVEIWHGFIFVNLDAQAAPLIETLRPLDERLGRQAKRSAKLFDSHPIACNWKLYVENYLDGYHREGVHQELASEAGSKRHEVRITGKVALYEVPNRATSAEGLWAWVWPNFGLHVYHGVLLLEHMRPDGPDRIVIDHIFLHEPEDPSVDSAIHDSQRITDEDAWICERVQRNMDAGIFRHGVLSPTNEGAVAWFQDHVAQAVAES